MKHGKQYIMVGKGGGKYVPHPANDLYVHRMSVSNYVTNRNVRLGGTQTTEQVVQQRMNSHLSKTGTL